MKQVEQEFDMLSVADQLREDLSEAYSLLDSGDRSLNALLAETTAAIGKVNLSLFAEDG